MSECLLLVVALLGASETPGDDWPQFRGPGGGRSIAHFLPVTWSESENIVWKTPIHDRGWSSPVVGDGLVWLTTASEDGKQMFAIAVDSNTGKVVHDRLVFTTPEPQPAHATNSYASPTPVVEPGRVYVHFGRYGTACLDALTGKVIWQRRDLLCEHFSGPGSSPIVVGDILVLTFDGIDVQYLAGLDKQTGKTVWKTDRSTDFGDIEGDRRKAFSTPLVLPRQDGATLVSCGAQAAMAYDAASGRELWKVDYSGFSNAPMPAVWFDRIVMATGFSRPQLLCFRMGGKGGITDIRLAWKATANIPAKPSPVIDDWLVYLVDDRGVASCLDVRDGKQIWRERLGGNFSASPLMAEGRIYFFDEEGTATVVSAGSSFEVLARNELDEGAMASPAAIERALIVRTKTHLYRIGGP